MRRWSLRGVLLALLGVLATLVWSGVSVAADVVTIASPSDGAQYEAPFAGPMSVDIASGSQTGTYTLSVTGPAGYAWQTTWDYDGSQSSNSWPITTATTAGRYTATVTAPDSTIDATTSFTVAPPLPPPPPRLAVSGAAVSTTPFYPLERDGYRDTTVFRFTTNLSAWDRVTIRNHLGQTVRYVNFGTLSGGVRHSFLWRGRKDNGRMVSPGIFTIRLAASRGGVTVHSSYVQVSLRALPAAIVSAGVSPRAFNPKPDGYRDYTHFRFQTAFKASDTIRVINSKERLVRSAKLGLLSGRHTHDWRWGGHSNGGKALPAGTYRINVTTVRYGHRVVGRWNRVSLRKPKPRRHSGGGGSNCTPGYSPCLVYHGGADYDCYGGGGNGPYYTKPGVVYRVTRSDPYGLDANHDGWGCQS
jgi:flagellar hook assembly protein FlgD